MRSETTRPSLLSRVRDTSDAAAWREFDDQYGDLILRYCRRRGLQLADAEDVRQNVMVKLSQLLRAFDYTPARGRFRAYVGRAVQHAIVDLRRTGAPGAIAGQALENMPADTEPNAEWEEEWLRHHHRRALQEIRRTHQAQTVEVFDSLLAGQTVEAAAARFGLTPDAVYKIKQRLTRQAKELVEAQIRAEDESGG